MKVSLELTQREVKALIAAMQLARDQTNNSGWRWWHNTRYADDLFFTLIGKVDRPDGWMKPLARVMSEGWSRGARAT